MKLRCMVIVALLAAMGLFAMPHRVAAATPTCHGQAATVVVGSSHSVTVEDDDAVVVGTSGADTITVNGYNPLVCAGGGNDSVVLNDLGTAYLGSGNDTGWANWFGAIYGESGNDKLTAGDTCSYVNGGSGNDEVYAYFCSTADGGSGNDYVYGSGADNLYGGSGRDDVESYDTAGTVDCGSNYDTYYTDGTETTLLHCEEESNPCACFVTPGGFGFSARAVEVAKL